MNERGLREGLLAAEAPSPELQRKYGERLRAIVERRLTTFERVAHVCGGLFALATAARCAQLFLQHRADGRPVALVGLAVALVFLLGWSAYSFVLLRRGAEDMRLHGFVRAQLIGVFTFALAGIMLWAGLESPDPARGNQLILFGLVFWCTMGLPFYLVHAIQQNTLRIRQDMLRLELALTERDELRA